MKINLSKKEIEKILLEKEMNIAAAQGLFDYCFYSRDLGKINHQEAILNYLELNLSNDEDRYFYESRIKPAFIQMVDNAFDDNYYRNKIRVKPFRGSGYELKYLSVNPNQCLPVDDIKIDKNYVELSQIGYFCKKFDYLAVLKNDVVWMSTDPNEINTMAPSIKEATRSVLAFGLGLGYFPIMAAVKPEVTSVTIIEKDQKIIDIFNKHILPLFEYKDKIKVIHDDAFKFAEKDLSKYDYLFIDIWHNPEDGLPMYLKFKRILKNKKIKTAYWLEKSILAMYRRCLLTIIEENQLGYTDKKYQTAKNDYDRIINDLYFKTKNVSISSKDELNKVLQDKYLLTLV